MSIKSLLSKLLDSFLANKKSDVSHYAMPSKEYVVVSFSKDQGYTAPYDGYFCASVRSTAANQWLNLTVNSYSLIENRSTSAGSLLAFYVPVSKGDRIFFDHNGGNAVAFRMYKSNGSV